MFDVNYSVGEGGGVLLFLVAEVKAVNSDGGSIVLEMHWVYSF